MVQGSPILGKKNIGVRLIFVGHWLTSFMACFWMRKAMLHHHILGVAYIFRHSHAIIYSIRLESQILHKAFWNLWTPDFFHKNSHNGYSLYLLIPRKISGIVDLIFDKKLPKVNTIPTSKPTHWMKPIWMLGWILGIFPGMGQYTICMSQPPKLLLVKEEVKAFQTISTHFKQFQPISTHFNPFQPCV